MKLTYSMATTWGGKALHAIILRPEMKGEMYPSDARTLCGLEFWSNYDAMIQHPEMSWSVPEALTCKKCIAIHESREGKAPEKICDMEQEVFKTGSRCIKPFAHPGACDYRKEGA